MRKYTKKEINSLTMAVASGRTIAAWCAEKEIPADYVTQWLGAYPEFAARVNGAKNSTDQIQESLMVKKKTGRPKGSGSKYTPDREDRIIAWIESGKPLAEWARNEGLSVRIIYDWMAERESFASRFARARDIGYDAIAQQCMDIADTPQMGLTQTYEDGTVVSAREEDMVQHRKLQIDTRKWLLARWSPKKYSDRVVHAGDEDAPLTVVIAPPDAGL